MTQVVNVFNTKMYGLNKDNSYKTWYIQVDGTADHAVLMIESGKEGGKQKRQVEEFTEGKQGRNAVQQAEFEANARVKKNLDKNYRLTKEQLQDLPILAMLAQDASGELEKRITQAMLDEGVIVSDKFDGLRMMAKCVATDHGKSVDLFSRTNQLMDIPHIKAALLEIMQPGEILDGELYVHNEALQDIKSAADRTDTMGEIQKVTKKLQKHMSIEHDKRADDWVSKGAELSIELEDALHIHELRPKLQFHVFDLVQLNVPFEERLVRLQEYAKERFANQFLQVVEYRVAHSYEELYAGHKDAIDRGYEGLMIRVKGFVYESGKRSNGIWKFKSFIDGEFMILDIIPDKQDGCRFVLRNNKPNRKGEFEEFRCVMGTVEERMRFLENKDKYIMSWMTVQFQSRYKKTMLPQFPTGKAFREGQVIDGEFVPTY